MAFQSGEFRFDSRLQPLGVPCSANSKESASNTGDLGLIPGLRESPEEGNGNPLQYSCLENPIDRGAWWAKVHGVAKSQAPDCKMAAVS